MSELPPARSQLGEYTGVGARTNQLAIISLVISILSFFANVVPFLGGAIVSIVAIVTGFMARGQIKRTGEQGLLLANLGIIIGFVHLALGFLVLMALLFLVFVVGITLSGLFTHSSPTPVPSG